MHRLQRLLLDRLHPHRREVGTARRFEQGASVGGIGLVALDVGAHVRRRQQSDLDPQAVEPARPVMRGAAGFHHHQAHGTISEKALELGTRQPLLLDHPPRTIGDRELEHRLRKIDSHNRQSSGSIHVGLPLVALTPHTT
jgi:hypothetical protein